MTAPPRAVESLLSSLGAAPVFRDTVLGDLAEEFAMRARRDGIAAARLWYYAEALRSAPHLTRDSLSHATRRDASRIAGSIVTTLAGMWILGIVLAGMALGVLRAAGVSLPVGIDVRSSPLAMGIGLALGALGTLAGGYFVAWMDDETPMLSVLTFALLWAVVDAIAFVAGQHYAWQAVVPLMPLVGVTIGGVLRVAKRGEG